MLGTYTRNHQYMFAAMFLWGFGMGMFIFIQPLFIESLGATTAQVGFALAAGGLTVTALYIPIGMWADRRGRRITILAGWWLASFATILMAVAPDWRWLIPGLIMYQLANFAMPAFNGYVAAESAGRSLMRPITMLERMKNTPAIKYTARKPSCSPSQPPIAGDMTRPMAAPLVMNASVPLRLRPADSAAT